MFAKSCHKYFTINHYPQLFSTNSTALELANSYQINHNHIILADAQSGGKGRMGRNWVSPIGNLYFSLVLTPSKLSSEVSELSFLTAVAIGLTLFEFLCDGVNINSHPENTNYPACILNEPGFQIVDKIDLLKKFLDNFSILYQKWLDFGFVPIRNLWLEKAFNLNQEIAVNLPNQSLRGIFKNLDEKGNLVLEVNNQIQLIASGEVFS